MPRGTLPAAPARLVPRHREQREIVRVLLEDDVRLLTLVGPPGAGKTRLALMAAGEVASAFRDGVVFVDSAYSTTPPWCRPLSVRHSGCGRPRIGSSNA